MSKDFVDFLKPWAERRQAEFQAIRKEIADKGTYWAADEIDRLRREVKGLRRDLERLEREHG